MKKILSSMLTATLLSVSLFSSSIFAENSTDQREVISKIDQQNAYQLSEEELDKNLLNVGYSTERLFAMPLDLKQELVKDGAIKLVETTVLRESNQEVQKGQMMPLGTIGDDKITGLLERTELASSGGNKRFKLTFNWVWNDDTLYNLTDKVGISYDSGFQTDIITNGGYACSHSTIYKPTGSYVYQDNCGGSPGNIDYGGANWNVDVLAGAADAGWSAMNIIAKSSTSGSTQGTILLKYIHDTSLTFGIGVTIGPLLLSYTSTGSYDEKPWQSTFYY